jgi:hypothetical protein
MEDILKNTIEELDKNYQELGKMKDQLLSMSLESFNYLFEGDDPMYTKMDQNSKKETISALEDDLLPLFKENDYKEGIKKVKNYIKLLNE